MLITMACHKDSQDAGLVQASSLCPSSEKLLKVQPGRPGLKTQVACADLASEGFDDGAKNAHGGSQLPVVIWFKDTNVKSFRE